jgi:hypothetical protein
VLLTSFVSLQPAPAMAQGNNRYPDRWEQRDERRARQRARQEERRERREERREWREDRRDMRRGGYGARDGYWDPALYYERDDRRYRPRRLGRNDRIYRGSDNRYYCERDNGTTGLIVGGIAGGVLGNIIAPRHSKTLGAIIGAGAGALLGRAIDDGDVVCR